MSQMRLIWWWPKRSLSATTTTTGSGGGTGKSSSKTEMVDGEGGGRNCCCGCVGKLVRKMRRQGRLLRAAARTSRQSSFQCRYDPLSYALNFDSSGGGGCMLDDEDYYQFCAFSSRFVAAKCPDTRFITS